MTNRQIKNNIDKLDFWLDSNPKHPDFKNKEYERKQLIENLTIKF